MTFIICNDDNSSELDVSAPDLDSDVPTTNWWYTHNSGIITRNILTGLTFMPFNRGVTRVFNSPLSSDQDGSFNPLQKIQQFVCDGTFFNEDGLVSPSQYFNCQFAIE